VRLQGVLPNDDEIAVKKLMDFHQGVNDFLNEVILITGIRHPNLVQLKGCCMKDNLRVLIYEYVENGDLAKALWDGNLSINPLLCFKCFILKYSREPASLTYIMSRIYIDFLKDSIILKG
jgi:hypothetical protein